jgi:hypothetical protein
MGRVTSLDGKVERIVGRDPGPGPLARERALWSVRSSISAIADPRPRPSYSEELFVLGISREEKELPLLSQRSRR